MPASPHSEVWRSGWPGRWEGSSDFQFLASESKCARSSTYFGIDGKARSPSGEKTKDSGEVPSIPFRRSSVEIRAEKDESLPVSQQQPFKGSSSVKAAKQ